MAKKTGGSNSGVLAEIKAIQEKAAEQIKTKADGLKERRRNLMDEVSEIDAALASIGMAPRGSGRKSSGGGDSSIRWGSKNNGIIADAIEKGASTLTEIKAFAEKKLGKDYSEASIYQAANTLTKNDGLSKNGDKYGKGSKFRTAAA